MAPTSTTRKDQKLRKTHRPTLPCARIADSLHHPDRCAPTSENMIDDCDMVHKLIDNIHATPTITFGQLFWDGGCGASNPVSMVQHFHDESLPIESDVHLKRSDSSSIGVLPLSVPTSVKDAGLIGAAQRVEHTKWQATVVPVYTPST